VSDEHLIEVLRFARSIAIHPETKEIITALYTWYLHPDQLEQAKAAPESGTIKMYREAHRSELERQVEDLTQQLAEKGETVSWWFEQHELRKGERDDLTKQLDVERNTSKRLYKQAEQSMTLTKQLAERQWISVDERQPEDGRYFVRLTNYHFTPPASWESAEDFKNGRWICGHATVTHWMPIPGLTQEPTT
jgi:hypothetical protein